jgi:hypothetical protein
MLTHYLKHLTLHTPLVALAAPLQQLAALPRRLSQPELREIRQEPKLLAAACRLLLLPQSSTIGAGGALDSQLALCLSQAPDGKHLAFEHDEKTARRLRRKFPNVDVRETALLGDALKRELSDAQTAPDESELTAPADTEDILSAMRHEGRSLDTLIAPDDAIDLIRLSLAGAELFVMMGAEQLLQRCRPSLVFSSTLASLRHWELRPEDVFDYLNGLGYRVFLPRTFVAGGGPLLRAEFSEAHATPLLACNFIATAPERVCGRRLIQRSARRSQRIPLAGQVNVA